MTNQKAIKGDINKDFLKEVEELHNLEQISVDMKASLKQKGFFIWSEMTQKISETTAGIRKMFATILNSQKGLERQMGKIDSKLHENEEELFELSIKVETFEKNLNQLTLLEQRVADRVDRLSEEFIDRFIRAPLIKDTGDIYNSIKTLNNNGDHLNPEILDQFKTMFESHEASIIEPQRGDAFNPREHQAIKKIKTTEEDMDGRIYSTHRTGLKLKERVIRHALVTLFTTS